MRWTQQHYDNMQKLVAEGKPEAVAARELGIPTGTIGNLKLRFGQGDPVADRIYEALCQHGELTRTDISSKVFARNIKAERISQALALLATGGKARMQMRSTEVEGRPSEVWFPANGATGAESPIGGLAQELNTYTEKLLDLAAEMSELTKHAHGLTLLDKTLGQLEARQQEAAGLRRRLGEAEKRLISRASVVHSSD
jgi:predicted ArsR family transcriptional regulator